MRDLRGSRSRAKSSFNMMVRWRNKRIAEPDIGYTDLMPTFTVEQVTAARAFLGWSQRDLGDASGLSFETVRDFEHDEQSATTKGVEAIRAAFHDAGVDFLKRGKQVGSTIVVQCQVE
jgi:ribosome-binding protein aMBF1 (putative translation factor)